MIKQGIFDDELQIADLLCLLSYQSFIDEDYSGLFEDLAIGGYSDSQYQAIFDLGLAELRSKIGTHEFPEDPADFDKIEWFELTPTGRKVLSQIRKSSSA